MSLRHGHREVNLAAISKATRKLNGRQMTEVRIPTTASFSVRGLFERRRFSTIAIDPKKAPARQPIPQLKGPEMAQKIEALARLDSE